MAIFHVGQRLTDGANVDVLVERVATGGFGEVAMGPDRLSKGRWRAIKVLRPDLLTRLGIPPSSAAYAAAEQRLRAGFLHEALTWRGLWPHPNLLVAQFVTQINNILMLVLDYAEQGSLRDYFITTRSRGAWLTLDTALELAQQIAAGLLALHTPAPDLLRPDPIVHRDLKPENILLSTYGAKITDFGLAKAVSEASATAPAAAHLSGDDLDGAATFQAGPIVATATQTYPTQLGQMLGTPAYMAPEQWLDAALAGQAADAYTFGLIVAELITGQHPLLLLNQPHTLDEWRAAQMAGRPIPLQQLGAAVFAAQRARRDANWGARQEAALEQVERLVARLLAKQEEARPSLGAALEGLQAAAVMLGERPAYTSDVDFYPPTAERLVIFWQGLAGAYDNFGLRDMALAVIKRALAIAPKDPNSVSTYAHILDGLGRYGEALEAFRQSLEEVPQEDRRRQATFLVNIGGCLRQLGQYAETEAAYADSAAVIPSSGAWYGRALNATLWAMAELVGRQEAARTLVAKGLEYSEQALQLNPDEPDLHLVAQTLLRMQTKLKE